MSYELKILRHCGKKERTEVKKKPYSHNYAHRPVQSLLRNLLCFEFSRMFSFPVLVRTVQQVLHSISEAGVDEDDHGTGDISVESRQSPHLETLLPDQAHIYVRSAI